VHQADLQLASDGFRIALERRQRWTVSESVLEPRDCARRRSHSLRDNLLQQVGAHPGPRKLPAQSVENRVGNEAVSDPALNRLAFVVALQSVHGQPSVVATPSD